MAQSSQRPPRIAVVGSGPSGCFLAGALRRALPEAEITVIDRLPCPFGLVRYGVAADHQSTKAITRQFDRLFTREAIAFAGNVHIGETPGPTTLTMSDLSKRADAVVLATGLSADRALGVPGENLRGVVGAGAVTRLLNSHPDDSHTLDLLSEIGERVAIVGLGNVAIDIVRLLSKDPSGFEGSDVNDDALAHYHRSPAKLIRVFSRSALADVKCDAAMIKELAQIPGLRTVLHGHTPERGSVPVNTESAEPTSPEDTRKAQTQANRGAALLDLAATTADRADVRAELHIHFSARPIAILGTGEDPATAEDPATDPDGPRSNRVGAIQVEHATDTTLATFDVDSVISAIGFEADVHTPLTAESSDAEATAKADSGRVRPGLYRVGWLKRGPRGTIPENRTDAMAVSREIVADFASGAISMAPDLEPLLPEAIARTSVSYEQWLRIDQHEVESSREQRVRAKVHRIDDMLSIARPPS